MEDRPHAPEGSFANHVRDQLDHLRLAQLSLAQSGPHLLSLCVPSVAFGVGAHKFLHVSVLTSSFLSIGVVVLCCVYACVGDPRKGRSQGFGAEVARLFHASEDDIIIGDATLSDLSDEEIKLLQYFRSITVDLKSEKAIFRTWSMVGGGKPGVGAQEQLSFTAIRYHASFLCYAVATITMRIPSFSYCGGEIILWVLENLLLKPKVFEFYLHYWPELKKKGPFVCRENIMWLGHVLHVAALYEMLTKDNRYSVRHGLKVIESDGEEYSTSLPELALHLAASMRINATGGVPCEPGLVFFQCQNHPFCGFTLLEGLGHFPRGFFNEEKHRFQDFAVKGMRAVVETGGIKIACVTTKQNNEAFDKAYDRELATLENRLVGGKSIAKSDGDTDNGTASPSRILASLPFAHIGSDAWDLNYLFFWATSTAAVEKIYEDFVKARIDDLREFGTWGDEAASCCRREKEEGAADLGGWNSAPPAVCCFGLNIPKSAWSSAILPVLAQVKDWKNFSLVETWLKRNLRQETSSSRAWLGESCEWEIGNTANYAMAVAMKNGSDVRALHHGLWLNNNKSNGAATVVSCSPKSLQVWRCKENTEGTGLSFGFTMVASSVAKFVLQPSASRREAKLKLSVVGRTELQEGLDLKWRETSNGGIEISVVRKKANDTASQGIFGGFFASSTEEKKEIGEEDEGEEVGEEDEEASWRRKRIEFSVNLKASPL